MNEAELRRVVESGVVQEFPWLAGLQADSIVDHLVINGKVALPVQRVDCSLNQDEDLEIEAEDGSFLGMLCFCRKLEEVEIARLTEWQLTAYLSEVAPAEFNQPYRFRKDYVVVEAQNLPRYKSDLLKSAPLWGGFWHEQSSAEPVLRTTKVPKLTAIAGINVPTSHHFVALRRAIFSVDPLDRFLKLYHVAELLFDWVVVRRIQGLGDDLLGIGRILSDYAANDLARLKAVVRSYAGNPVRLSCKLAQVASHQPTAEKIFQVYGKDGNPLKEPEKWRAFLELLLSSGPISLSAAKQRSVAQRQEQLDDLIRDVTAYWIFRIRCCIAHNRIGEYIIGDDEEKFLLEFGEPLLREALIQILQHPDIKGFAP